MHVLIAVLALVGEGSASEGAWPWVPEPAVVTLARGDAALASAEGVVDLEAGAPARVAPTPAYVEVAALGELSAAWPRRSSLRVEGPAALEWRQDRDEIVLGLVEARALHLETRRDGALELDGGWRVDLAPGAVYLASRPDGGWTLRVEAGGPMVLWHPREGDWRRRESLPAGAYVTLASTGAREQRSAVAARRLTPSFTVSAPPSAPWLPGPTEGIVAAPTGDPGPVATAPIDLAELEAVPGPRVEVEPLAGPAGRLGLRPDDPVAGSPTPELPGPGLRPAPVAEAAEPPLELHWRPLVAGGVAAGTPADRAVPPAAREAGESREERTPPPPAEDDPPGPATLGADTETSGPAPRPGGTTGPAGVGDGSSVKTSSGAPGAAG